MHDGYRGRSELPEALVQTLRLEAHDPEHTQGRGRVGASHKEASAPSGQLRFYPRVA
jgi:hypothetical protein